MLTTQQTKKRSDPLGVWMVILICAIVWYRDFVTKYMQISNMLLLLGGGLVLIVIFDLLNGRGRRAFFSLPKAIYLITAYMALTYLFGFLTAPTISVHFSEGLTYVEFTVIMLCICYYAKTRGSTRFLVINYALVYTLMAFLFVLDPVVVSEGAVTRYSFSRDMNSNSFAMALTMGIWSLLYLTSLNKLKLWISAPICGVMMYASFMTGSRKGIFGLLIVFVLWIFVCYLRPGQNISVGKKFGRLAAIVAVVTVGLIILLPYFENSAVAYRLGIMGEDTSSDLRMEMYSKGVEYVSQSPLVGYGFGGFRQFYGLYSHATWVEVFVAAGIPLAILYFSSYVNIFANICRVAGKRVRHFLSPTTDVHVRMHAILFVVMMFYTISIIHIYNINSFYSFAMIIMSLAGAKQEITEHMESEECRYVTQR